MQIIDGKKLRDEILSKIKIEVADLPFQPLFCDILVGNDLSSLQYVKMKAKIAESVGIKFHSVNFKDSASTEEVIAEIENLNKIPNMCGIIIQLPLPSQIDKRKVLDAIKPELDVDCLGMINSENFYHNNGEISYPTALACMKVLESLNIDFSNKKILILGQGNLVGRPVTYLLRARGLDIITINTKTLNTEILIKNADIIISAIGKGKFLTGDMVKKNAIIIDAGTSEENGAVVGDVDFESMKEIVSHISPTPGGVGPVTVAMLLSNVLKVAQKLSPTPGVGESK
jgi:methylenetetrahydrofolate dehydrogenase (NADP+)/methenyltetrahydrofolate cyclohydrolase